MERHTVTRSSAEWVDIINRAGVPCGPINSIDETFADPQVRYLGMAARVDHPKLGPIELVGQGVNLGATPFRIRSAPPERGEHTQAILHEFGYADADIDDMRASGAI